MFGNDFPCCGGPRHKGEPNRMRERVDMRAIRRTRQVFLWTPGRHRAEWRPAGVR